MPSAIVVSCSKLLAKMGLTIVFVESATAGRLCSEFALTAESGKILKGGLVCYDACLKEDILKVPEKLIKKYTPESAEVTAELAKRLKKFIPADIHAAITGLTTPGGSETPEKPVGTIFIHVLFKDTSLAIAEVYKGTPEEIMLQAIDRVALTIISEIEFSGSH
ncbi:CinA family protein [Hufsiella ginkgonis]|uniref:Nicotinamide-nucleotide amidohydrolase family protein n=1 Tax=Hufsiella ginkgonis TaxID=2695274 RepID=A0A7K1Y0G5_9SPHI|nr:nicotinamide-nucleotide amidohydrolase family protein [Hufsiella ginkgonis]MXV16720.1 nicotinamide-nucleotide amidohydrolase family protein [Hufsiella ginkgonis]